ncbi:MAG: protein kinase [Myxococcota bacterium]
MDDAAIARAHDLTGAVLGGRYEVLGKLGVGGMASVYEGRRVGLHNRVAIKVLRSELCEDPTNVKRFLREARASSVIEHENIVDIVDFGSTESLPVYFVMEFLEGDDLRKEIKKNGPMAWGRARPILGQIVSALAAAHDKAIVHRDVKPANIFLVRRANGEDFVKVLDFGIAKVVEETLGGLTQGHTMTNGLLGTVAYMAPEQARGGTIDARTDIYAVGVMAYQMLTGRVPFKGTNPYMVLEQHVQERPRPPSELNPDIPAFAETIVMRCLEKAPEDRYQSMNELAEVLDHARTLEYAPNAPVVIEPGAAPAKPAGWSPPPADAVQDFVAPQVQQTEALGSGTSGRASTSSVMATVVPAPAPSAGHTAAPSTVVGTTASPRRTAVAQPAVVSSRPRPANRGLLPALLVAGVVLGLAIAFGIVHFVLAPKPDAAPAEPADVVEPEQPTPAVTPTAKPPQPPVEEPTTPEPVPAEPEVVVATPKTAPEASETPKPKPAPRKPRRPRKPRKPAAEPVTQPAAATPEPKPKPQPKQPEDELHPDLRNPYG